MFDAGFRAEFESFDSDVRKAIAAYALVLASEGPQLGRPMADTLKGSKHANMKELRPTVNKVEWRVAYAFDTARKAIVLAAAAKGGRSATLVYRQMIAKADARFTAHQAALAAPPAAPPAGAAVRDAEGRPVGKRRPGR